MDGPGLCLGQALVAHPARDPVPRGLQCPVGAGGRVTAHWFVPSGQGPQESLLWPRGCSINAWHIQTKPRKHPWYKHPCSPRKEEVGPGSSGSSLHQSGSSVGSQLGIGALELAWPLSPWGDAERSPVLSKPLETCFHRVLSPEERFLL